MPSIVLDGNFSAQHRFMKNPHDDVPLADGKAFMVENAPFKQYLKEAGRNPLPVRSFRDAMFPSLIGRLTAGD